MVDVYGIPIAVEWNLASKHMPINVYRRIQNFEPCHIDRNYLNKFSRHTAAWFAVVRARSAHTQNRCCSLEFVNMLFSIALSVQTSFSRSPQTTTLIYSGARPRRFDAKSSIGENILPFLTKIFLRAHLNFKLVVEKCLRWMREEEKNGRHSAARQLGTRHIGIDKY